MTVARPDPYAIAVGADVRPRWVFRLPRATGLDGLCRRRGGALWRLLHHGATPVVVCVRQPAADRVHLLARSASHEAAEWAIARMRAALGVDQDLRPFYERFHGDPLIGPALRARPWLRVAGRPDPFEALMLAVCEQLIEYERAAAVERRLIAMLGRRCQSTGLADSPSAAEIACQPPARLQALGLSQGRAVALIAAAREVAEGRVDLFDADHERGWRRLSRIRGIGPWTLATMALTGQGRLDQIPAGDLGYLKLAGRLRSRTPGAPAPRATPEEVQRLFSPYAPWAGLAGLHALRASALPLGLRLAA
ncbi:MAG TPA: hypothetical protein VKV27_11540 [Solirubrobacteraceae bacterium]|nr:hypothetical protein [Solirubrobacteraceae bacterium]